MSIAAIEGIFENGQIRLPADARIPEHARVYVIVPDAGEHPKQVNFRSPVLAQRGQAADFRKEMIEDRS
jgi:hypothetical protein